MYKNKLLQMEIPANMYGFTLLNSALEIYEPRKTITGIYQELADQCNKNSNKTITSHAVEAAIRHAIKKTGVKMTNAKFIAEYKLKFDQE